MAKPNFILPNKPAIKAGSILSYNYTDDLKFAAEPLDFSRNSSATRVNEQGLIEEVGYFGPQLVQNGDFSQEGSELVTNGNFATDSDWNLSSGATISNGKLIVTNAAQNSLIATQSNVVPTQKPCKLQLQIVVNSGSFRILLGSGGTSTQIFASGTYTFYETSGSFGEIYLQARTGGFDGSIDNVSVKEVGQDWDFSSGASLTDLGAKITHTPTAGQITQANSLVVGKQYKFTYEITESISGGVKINSAVVPTMVSTVGVHTKYFEADETVLYIARTDSTGNNVTITNISVIEILGDKPRIDYSDSSTEPSLLLEPQSTNLIPYSEDFSGYYKGSNTTLTYESNVVAPDGSLGVYRLQMPNLGSSWLSFGFLGNTSRNASIYVKSVNDGVNNQFNINATGISPNTLTATNNWQRFSRDFGSNQNYDVGINNGLDTYTTDVYIFGAQVEALSYATSYIPTSGSTATRLGETANNAGGAGVFNSEEGVLYAEIAALANSVAFQRLSLSNGTGSNRVYLQNSTANNQIYVSVVSGGVSSVDVSTTSYDITQFNKIAIKFKANDFALWINGIEVATDINAVMPIGLNELAYDDGNGGLQYFGKTKNLQVFNYALTDEELQTLTT